MRLLAHYPLWIVLLVLTVGIHVVFAVAVWRWMRGGDPPSSPPPGG